MDSLFSPVVLVGAVTVAVLLRLGLKLRNVFSSFSYIDGPPSAHWLYGDMFPKPGRDPLDDYSSFFDTYGPSFREIGLGGMPHLATIDPRACNHVFNKADVYQKPGVTSWLLGMITGDTGLLVAEGDQHRRIRRIVAPSFALVHIKEMVPIFLDKASQLVELVELHLGDKEVDIKKHTASCTFDIIGAAGFGTDLGCMDPNGKPSELVKAMDESSDSMIEDSGILTVLQAFVPIFRSIPTKQVRAMTGAKRKVEIIGRDIINRKRAEILSGSRGDQKINKEDVGGGKDLLSVILRASLAADVADNQKLSDEELIAQIVTFILAGFETSSTSVTLTLEALCDDTDVQDKLRKELLAVENDQPDYDELNDLPYLDAVVKESLRRFPPAPSTIRIAMQDDLLPLSVPVKNVRTGAMMHELPVKKGELIIIPTQNMHTSTLFYGEDAGKFDPTRFLSPLPPSTHPLKPFWESMGTFHAGPKACIGMRFALIEIKALLFTLIRAFEFQHLDPKPEIYHALSIVSRPMVKGREREGGMLPVRVRRVGACSGRGREGGRERS